MNKVYEKLKQCEESIRSRVDFEPRVALVLGSGLGDYAEQMQVEAVLDYSDIDGFPVSTAPGHKGQLVFGYVGETPVVCLNGRIHYYEGYDISDVVLPIRLAGLLGAKYLFLTNASGGIKMGFDPGDLMLIEDQIASLLPSPLRGANIPQLGTRFPDMSEIYDRKLCKLARRKAMELDITLKEGVYIQTSGPQYESPAEIRFYRTVGADAEGMSTGVEAIAGRHMGMQIIGISCIANLAAGISPHPLSEEEVLAAGKKRSGKFTRLVTAIIQEL